MNLNCIIYLFIIHLDKCQKHVVLANRLYYNGIDTSEMF